jgi:hypothetical protein
MKPNTATVATAAIVLVVVLVALPLPAGAQTTPAPDNTSTASDDADLSDGPVRLTEHILLADRSYEDGVARVTLIVENRPQAITLTGAVDGFGEVPRTQTRLTPGRHTIQVPSESRAGATQITLETDEALYAIPFKSGQFVLVGGPWTAGDVQLSALLASLATAIGAIWYLKVGYGPSDDKPEVLT